MLFDRFGKFGKKMSRAVKIALLTCAVAPLMFMLSSCTPPPESLTVIAIMPPRDFDVVLIANNQMEIRRTGRRLGWEVHHRFENCWCCDGMNARTLALRVTSRGEIFDINIDAEMLNRHHSVIMLNHRDRTITSGIPQTRSTLLISLRIILITAVMAVIFYLFGYRKIRSWIAFTIIMLTSPWTIFINIIADGEFIFPTGIFSMVMMDWIVGSIVNMLQIAAMCIAINEKENKGMTMASVMTMHYARTFLFTLWMMFLSS